MTGYDPDQPSYWDDELDNQLEKVKNILDSIASDNTAFNDIGIDISEIIKALENQRDKFRDLTNRLASVSAESVELVVDLEEKNKRLAIVTAESAEIMAELEQSNKTLHDANSELAKANAYASELMAEIELKDKKIEKLNDALANANAQASELVAELELNREELQGSERNYHSLFENMLNGFALNCIVLNEDDEPVDYIFLDVNDAFEKMTGLKKGNLIGNRITEVLPGIEHDQGDWIRRYGKVALENKEIRFEQYSNVLKKWYSVYAYCPKPGYFATIFEDITARKETEEELRRSEQRLKILFESAPNAIYLSDLEGNLIDGNKAAEQLVGYKREEFVGSNFLKLDLLPPEYIEKAAQGLVKEIEGEPTGPDEFVLSRKDGTQVWVEIMTYPVNIEGKDMSLGIAYDITNRKKMEFDLKESEKRYRMLFDSVNEGILHFDEKGVIIDANPKLLDIIGHKREEIVKMDIMDLLPTLNVDMGSAQTALQQTLSDGLPEVDEWKMINRKGKEIVLSARPNLIKKGEEILGISVILDDITERKKAQEELIQKVTELERYKKVTVDREMKMIELKKEMKALRAELRGVKKDAP